MQIKKQKMIEYLLCNANPSIKYRVRDEILQDLTPEDAEKYRKQIISESMIQRITSVQKENGWIGTSLHGGFETQEGGTKYLAEKAVGRDSPVLKNAMNAFKTVPLDDFCYDTRGIIIDEFKVTGHGHNLIRCACIARAGFDDIIDISPQIKLSLDCFQRVLDIDSVLDITRPARKGKIRVFLEGEKWPCRYHLDMLAHTESWKNQKNIKMLADSIAKLMKTDNPALVNLVPSSWIGHALGPLGGFPAQGLSVKATCLLPSPILLQNINKPIVYQTEYIEWFARCGIVNYIPQLREAADDILKSVDENGVCNAPVLEVHGWGPYCGMQLEVDWKQKVRRNCDITFRALLILHYSESAPV